MKSVTGLVAAISLAVAGAAMAQTAPQSKQPGNKFDIAPLPERGGTPVFNRSERTANAPAPRGNVDVRFTLKRVILAPEASPLAATDGLSQAIQQAIGATADLAALEGLRRRLTEALVAAGYVSSGVRLTEIDLDAGIATYQIVEGQVSEVRVAGEGVSERDLGDVTPDYVRELSLIHI